jgi:hypothetical protein
MLFRLLDQASRNENLSVRTQLAARQWQLRITPNARKVLDLIGDGHIDEARELAQSLPDSELRNDMERAADIMAEGLERLSLDEGSTREFDAAHLQAQTISMKELAARQSGVVDDPAQEQFQQQAHDSPSTLSEPTGAYRSATANRKPSGEVKDPRRLFRFLDKVSDMQKLPIRVRLAATNLQIRMTPKAQRVQALVAEDRLDEARDVASSMPNSSMHSYLDAGIAGRAGYLDNQACMVRQRQARIDAARQEIRQQIKTDTVELARAPERVRVVGSQLEQEVAKLVPESDYLEMGRDMSDDERSGLRKEYVSRKNEAIKEVVRQHIRAQQEREIGTDSQDTSPVPERESDLGPDL